MASRFAAAGNTCRKAVARNRCGPSAKEGPPTSQLKYPADLVVGWDSDRIHFSDFGRDNLLHLAHPGKVWVYIPFGLPVEDLLAIYEYFHNALSPRGNGQRNIGAVSPEKLIRHPRGGSEVLSRYAVGDLDLDFAFHPGSSLKVGRIRYPPIVA